MPAWRNATRKPRAVFPSAPLQRGYPRAFRRHARAGVGARRAGRRRRDRARATGVLGLLAQRRRGRVDAFLATGARGGLARYLRAEQARRHGHRRQSATADGQSAVREGSGRRRQGRHERGPDRTHRRPLRLVRHRRPAPPRTSKKPGRASPGLPAYRGRGRPAVSAHDERRGRDLALSRHRLRPALARQVLSAGRLAG